MGPPKRDEVHRLLGKPAKVQAYKLQQEEIWDWRFSDRATEIKVFSVTFDSAGAVKSTSATLDPKEAGQRGWVRENFGEHGVPALAGQLIAQHAGAMGPSPSSLNCSHKPAPA